MYDLRERDRWNRLCASPLHEVLIGVRATDDAIHSYAAGSNESDRADQEELAEPRRLEGLL
jgi:hypothetical protein